jgi:hypothetical protein
MANYRAVPLGWSKMLFCNNQHGINGAVPPDILHMIRHGLMQYLLESFFGLKQLLPKKRKTDSTVSEQVAEESSVSEDDNESVVSADNYHAVVSDDERIEDISAIDDVSTSVNDDVQATAVDYMSKIGVFTKPIKQMIDVYVKRLGRHLQRQSCKD